MVMIAAGWCKNVEKCSEALQVPDWTHLVVGSYTLQPRTGNPGTTYVELDDGSTINSKGLPNAGLADPRTLDVIDTMRTACENDGRTLVLSVAERYAHDISVAVRMACDHAGVIEVNLSCPNTGGRILGMCPDDLHQVRLLVMRQIDAYLMQSTDAVLPEVWWKLSPLTDPNVRGRVVHELFHHRSSSEARVTQKIVACNTLPMGTHPGAHLVGGMGGPAVHHLNLANAAHYVRLCRDVAPHVDVIGCGGVDSRDTARAYRDVGCVDVQVGSAVHVNGAEAMKFVTHARKA